MRSNPHFFIAHIVNYLTIGPGDLLKFCQSILEKILDKLNYFCYNKYRNQENE